MLEQVARDIQIEAWINSHKMKCRQLAIEHASKLGSSSAGSLLKDAQEIYEWLIKDLNENK